ncbi:MAG: GAF domain-containing protein, partial [Gemmatimonadetes bacterium]|nr:GAF domain-containing protein [Gemmatimonadota bacterium]
EPPPAAAATPRPAPAVPPAPAARPRPITPLAAPPPKRPELGAFADPFSPDFAVSAGLPEDDEPARPNARVESLLEALELLLDFDRFSSHVLKLALDLTNGASGSLMLLQEDRRALRIIAAAGLSDIVVQKTRQRVGEGIAGRVAADGEPLLLVGTIGDERFRQRSERKEIRSSVCAPVIAEGQVIGVLNINSDPTNHPFDETQLRTVAALGRQLGSPLDRSRQLRRMRGRSFELSVRAEIEAIASSQDDMVSRMRRITARLVQMLDIDTCAIWLLDEARHGLTLRAVSGVTVASMDAVTVPVGTGLVGWVANNLRPLVLRNSADDPNDATRLTSTGVPIRWHTELVGVLAVESTSKNTTDDDRLGLLASVASVIGEQIGVSRAYEDSERKVTMLSALSELGVAFAAAQESSNLAKLVTFSASTVLESDVATIRFRRVDAPNPTGTHDFELLASHGGSIGGVGDPLGDLEEYITREVIAKRNPCRDADLPLQDIEPLMQRSNVASFLGAPMMSGRDLVGVVVVYRVQDAIGRNVGYRDEEIEIAMRLADYAAAAAARFVGATEPDDDYDAQH